LPTNKDESLKTHSLIWRDGFLTEYLTMIDGFYTAISALKAFQKKLGVTANDVSNAQTPGFKMSTTSSEDISPEEAYTASGDSKIGRGTTIGNIAEDFSQGSFEPTSSETDMAIEGEGFFMVAAANGERYYTRDGQFWFDKSGRLVNASGYVAQGWAFDPMTGQTQGSVQDIVIPTFIAPPQGTSIIENIVNLEAGSADKSVGLNGLSSAWDGGDSNGEFMPDGSYSYQTTTKVYDTVGGNHDVTIYFDKNGTGSEWEYIVTSHPSEDRRPGAAGKDLGLVARGTLTFDATGAVSGMTLENNDGIGNWTSQNPATDLTGGRFTFHPDFLGGAGGSTGMSIQLNFGSRYNGVSWVNDPSSSTQYFSPSKTAYAVADGYGAGDLQSISIKKDGIISGHFSNGRILNLFQITIANFNNPQGLEKIGHNLYVETSASGTAVMDKAGTGRAGTIVSNAREQSNVDMANEIVNTILIQRGFQANLKVVSTQDNMLGILLDVFS
jgi:flagellar hook protein FlgE